MIFKFVIISFICVTLSANAQVSLIKDIKTGSSGSFSYSLSKVVKNNCYFVADDGKNGDELWITDGTLNGTRLVKNIYPGSESCNPQAFGVDSDKLFFIANDSIHGSELWVTSGDEPSTQLLIDTKPGASGTLITIPFLENETFVSIGNNIYFINNYNEIFESDGTTNGTKSIIKFNSILEIVAHENKLFFIGNKEVFKDSIFVFDPITKSVSSIKTNLRNPSNLTSTPLGLIFDTGSKLYIYKSQSNLIEEITPSIAISDYKYTLSTAYFKGHFYLIAITNSGLKPILLKINGVSKQTEVLLNNALDNFSTYGNFVPEGEYLYYLYNASSSTPLELWRTDGSANGFIKLDEYNSASLSFVKKSNNLIGYGGKIYYFGKKGKILGLYESNGFVNGTKQLEQISDYDAFRQLTTGPILLGNLLLFSSEFKDNSIGQELYAYKLPIKTSVFNTLDFETLNIRPNPVLENLQLNNSKLIQKIDIIDQNGKLLRTYCNLPSQAVISLADLSSGFYFIRCFNDDNVFTKTFIKM